MKVYINIFVFGVLDCNCYSVYLNIDCFIYRGNKLDI